MFTFRFIIKSSILKILCNLTRLSKELLFNHFNLTIKDQLFPTSPLTISVSQFFWQDNRTREKAQIPSARSSPQPYHPSDIAPPPTSQLPLILLQGKCNSMLHHYTFPCATGGNSPFCFKKSFLLSLTLFFLFYCHGPPRLSHPIQTVTIPMYNLDGDGGRLGALLGG